MSIQDGNAADFPPGFTFGIFAVFPQGNPQKMCAFSEDLSLQIFLWILWKVIQKSMCLKSAVYLRVINSKIRINIFNCRYIVDFVFPSQDESQR